MADHEDEDLQMALRMSLQHAPEPKRSKPRESTAATAAEESPEARSRRIRRETLAAAAERRMMMGHTAAGSPQQPAGAGARVVVPAAAGTPERLAAGGKIAVGDHGEELSLADAEGLFSMVFGEGASKDIIEHWCKQGIKFSPDPETSMGLVQHEGGPCGVLAPIQAFILKYLLALVLSMVEILFSCGNGKKAVVATLSVVDPHSGEESVDTDRSEEHIQADRDDPSLPLVTAPFGHASQEIVNLLLCGQAVPNVFDGRMDLGGGMFLKGIPTFVEVGFLSLLESLNLCKVGQYLKCPKWPIWVVGSESHYTVLFALDTSVQDENEFEKREAEIRRAFDAQDQSGGGGFISSERLQHVLRETKVNMPPEMLENLASTAFIVWSEFWHALLQLDKSLGGMKDATGLIGKKQFDLYHFNGIAKAVSNGNQLTEGETLQQRPRLTELSVAVPPRWRPEEFLVELTPDLSNEQGEKDGNVEVDQPERSQHAPLVDCIRTRWPLAVCSWVGDAPSIV
ncbi:FAM188B protein [Nymphaea thermarum]|nr:FAM188B protein [Nymphaea thermarum]